MKRYLLRTTAKPASRANPMYLEAVRVTTAGHVCSIWTPTVDNARTFSPAQRARFEVEHACVRGRWVLAETARGAN